MTLMVGVGLPLVVQQLLVFAGPAMGRSDRGVASIVQRTGSCMGCNKLDKELIIFPLSQPALP